MAAIDTLMQEAIQHANDAMSTYDAAASTANSVAAGALSVAGPDYTQPNTGRLAIQSREMETDYEASGFAAPAGVVPVTPTEGHVYRGDHIEVYLPSKADPASIYNQFGARYQQIYDDAKNELARYFATYFPNQAAIAAAVEDWLQDTIAANGTNFQSVENAMWANSRNRIMAEQLSEENAMYAQFASRGFPLPTGALAAQLQELRIQQSNKLAEVSNTAAIKHLDISVDLIKFAISEANKLRLAAISMAADWIKALVLEPADIASRFVLQSGGLQADLIRAVGSYYGALLERDRILAQLRLGEKEIDVKWGGILASQTVRDVESRTHAAAAAASAAAEAAKGALSALNSIGAEIQST